MPGDPKGTVERGDSGAQEQSRMGRGTLGQLVSRQKVIGSGKTTWNV